MHEAQIDLLSQQVIHILYNILIRKLFHAMDARDNEWIWTVYTSSHMTQAKTYDKSTTALFSLPCRYVAFCLAFHCLQNIKHEQNGCFAILMCLSFLLVHSMFPIDLRCTRLWNQNDRVRIVSNRMRAIKIPAKAKSRRRRISIVRTNTNAHSTANMLEIRLNRSPPDRLHTDQ